MKTLPTERQVVFLDTNTLHYVGIYLKYAKRKGLFPWDTQASVPARDSSRGVLDRLTEKDLKKGLKRGMETVAFLATHDVEVQYSSISELELITARSKGKAVLNAAKEGIPDRIWSHFEETEVRDRLTPLALTTVIKGVDELTSLLIDSNVAVNAPAPRQDRDVLDLAKGINGLVYMEVMDSIIYANALLAEANLLFTADGYLRKTINLIHDPRGSGRYRRIQRKLKGLVGKTVLRDAIKIQLPSAHTITADGNLQPDLPVANAG